MLNHIKRFLIGFGIIGGAFAACILLAAYLPTILNLLFVGLSFLMFGILFYIVGWLILDWWDDRNAAKLLRG